MNKVSNQTTLLYRNISISFSLNRIVIIIFTHFSNAQMLLIRSIPLTSVTGSNLKYLLPEKQLCIQKLLCSLCIIYNSNITEVMSVDQYENKLRIYSVKILNIKIHGLTR